MDNKNKVSQTEIDLLFSVYNKVHELTAAVHDQKVDSLNALSEINKILVKQEANLETHMRRSQAVEDQLELLKAEITPILQGLGFLKTIFKVLSVIAGMFAAYSKFKR